MPIRLTRGNSRKSSLVRNHHQSNRSSRTAPKRVRSSAHKARPLTLSLVASNSRYTDRTCDSDKIITLLYALSCASGIRHEAEVGTDGIGRAFCRTVGAVLCWRPEKECANEQP